MKLLGLQKLTLLDFPGKVAAIVFLGGCNLRCPFCQNSPLVLSPDAQPPVDRAEFRSFLKKRAGILDGICISGGEPTLHSELPSLLEEIRSFGYLTKLDTNGTRPEMLRLLLDRKLLDYAAVDLKAGRSNYARVCGTDDDSSCTGQPASGRSRKNSAAALLESVSQTVSLLKNSEIDYEFRTTAVRGLHTEEDFRDIAGWISGCPHYYLQSFRDSEGVLQQPHPFSSFSEEELQHFLSIVQKTIPQAALRGV